MLTPLPSPSLQGWQKDNQEALGIHPFLVSCRFVPFLGQAKKQTPIQNHLKAHHMCCAGIQKPLSPLAFISTPPANPGGHSKFLCQLRHCSLSPALPLLICAVWIGCHRQPEHGTNPPSLHKGWAWSQQCVGNHMGCIADPTIHLAAKLGL